MTMETIVRASTSATNNRLQGRINTPGTRTGRTDRCLCLTSRDIEAETLKRLSYRGYDWTGALGARQRYHEWPCEEFSPEPARATLDESYDELGLAGSSRPVRRALVHA
ncbi:MAG: hypothetical protein ABI353_22855 [Isosphaeraceae bacterium]